MGARRSSTTLAYAWGLTIATYHGLPIVEHGGSLGGYRAHILRFPNQHTSIAVLCNLASANPSALARSVSDIVLKGVLTGGICCGGRAGVIETANSTRIDFDRNYAGRYYSPEVDATFEIVVRGDDVTLQRETDAAPVALLPYGGADEFRARGMTIRFDRDANFRVVSLTVDAGRVRGIVFTRTR